MNTVTARQLCEHIPLYFVRRILHPEFAHAMVPNTLTGYFTRIDINPDGTYSVYHGDSWAALKSMEPQLP